MVLLLLVKETVIFVLENKVEIPACAGMTQLRKMKICENVSPIKIRNV